MPGRIMTLLTLLSKTKKGGNLLTVIVHSTVIVKTGIPYYVLGDE